MQIPISVITDPISKKRYIIDGERWIPIRKSMTIEAARIWHSKQYPKPTFKPIVPKTFTVKSTRTAEIYTVTVQPNGHKHCTCIGYQYRRRCKHIDSISK